MTCPNDNPISAADLEAALLQLASQPKSANVNGVTVTQQSMPDFIAAAKYLAQINAAKLPARGLRFTKLVPPGAL